MRIIDTITPTTDTPTNNLILQQLNKSCRHHIIAMVNSLNHGFSPVHIITIRTKTSNKVRVTTSHFSSHRNAHRQDGGTSQLMNQFTCQFPKHQLAMGKMNRQRITAWHLNQSTMQTYTSVLVSMQIIAHAATWKRTTLQLVQPANALSDPEVVDIPSLFLIWSQQGSVIAP